MSEELQTFYCLRVVLAIGLLIGVERGWKERAAEEGGRVTGIRSYGLIGLLGGALALLSKRIGSLVPGLAFVGLASSTAVTLHLSRTAQRAAAMAPLQFCAANPVAAAGSGKASLRIAPELCCYAASTKPVCRAPRASWRPRQAAFLDVTVTVVYRSHRGYIAGL